MRIATLQKQPPMLLFTSPDKDMEDSDEYFKLGKSNLYSICEDKVYKNLGLESPRVVCLGSSYGWLIIGFKLAFEEKQDKEDEEDDDEEEEEDSGYKNLRIFEVSHILSIVLLNPSTQKIMQMPGIRSGKIRKAILSCDPSTCPDDFFLAALCDESISRVAFMRAGDEFWRFAIVSDDSFLYNACDIIFHKGLLYALDCFYRLSTIDYTSPKCDSSGRLQVQPLTSFWKIHSHHWYYLVEASNGDLLVVLRNILRSGECQRPGRFKVYKLSAEKTMPSSPDKEELGWVRIWELENNDAIFLAENTALCIPAASCYPNCIPSSIYFMHNFKDKRYEKLKNNSCSSEIGIFHIGNRTFGAFDGLGNSK